MAQRQQPREQSGLRAGAAAGMHDPGDLGARARRFPPPPARSPSRPTHRMRHTAPGTACARPPAVPRRSPAMARCGPHSTRPDAAPRRTADPAGCCRWSGSPAPGAASRPDMMPRWHSSPSTAHAAATCRAWLDCATPPRHHAVGTARPRRRQVELQFSNFVAAQTRARCSRPASPTATPPPAPPPAAASAPAASADAPASAAAKLAAGPAHPRQRPG